MRLNGAAAGTADVAPADRRRVSVLGATGSVGQNTLDLIARHPDRFEVIALTGHSNAARLAELAKQSRAKFAVIGDASCYQELKAALSGTSIRCAAGSNALVEAAAEPADCIMAAIMGAAGLRPTFTAVQQGRRLALANKECLVSAGDIFMQAVARASTELIPVDSEHSAAFQAISGADPTGIERITLTASGGPFRTWSKERIAAARPEEALKHPNWSMGRKITIDSATLMNKGLELIEAYHLFPVSARQLDVIVHPQSIVHCLVSFSDGSVLAQLACPDMRTPIAFSLSWPARMQAPTERLDLVKLGSLSFEEPDADRFPCLRIAREALDKGAGATAVLNAANEVAVEAYLDYKLGFLGIARLVAAVVEAADARGMCRPPAALDDVLAIDHESRQLARAMLGSYV
jgi:1-deoxy-D-xylulose-5-phosphate reductoisomerase